MIKRALNCFDIHKKCDRISLITETAFGRHHICLTFCDAKA